MVLEAPLYEAVDCGGINRRLSTNEYSQADYGHMLTVIVTGAFLTGSDPLGAEGEGHRW